MYLYLTLLLVNCLNMYLYLTLLLVKSLSMHLYLTLLLVSWPKDPLGGKTEYAAPRLQEATFLFQADTVEVQHGARFFSLLQTNISCLPLCSFLENWFCCFFVPPLGARLNRLPPGSKAAILFCQANTIFVVAKLLLFLSRIFVFVFVFVFVLQFVFQLDNERRADTGHRWVEILLTLYSARSSDNVVALVRPDQC